jgi:hypothetical protein
MGKYECISVTGAVFVSELAGHQRYPSHLHGFCVKLSSGTTEKAPQSQVVARAAALMLQALRLTLVQVLMNKQGYSLNPLQSLYYVSPACLLCLIVPFCEYSPARAESSSQSDQVLDTSTCHGLVLLTEEHVAASN